MKCLICGTKNKDNANFCSKCGSRLIQVEKKENNKSEKRKREKGS